jgi:hypothetical protein
MSTVHQDMVRRLLDEWLRQAASARARPLARFAR